MTFTRTAPVPGSRASFATAADDRHATAYERYADIFSRVYVDAHSIAIALEILDVHREREARTRPVSRDLPRRVLATAARLFDVPVTRLLERNRRTDVTSARYIAAWVLRRRRWTYAKIAALLGRDRSTIIHGLRKVAASDHLLLTAMKAEHLVDQDAARGAR
jgi:hypothetical protein